MVRWICISTLDCIVTHKVSRFHDTFLPQLDFWQPPSAVGRSVDIHVSPSAYPRLAKLLQANGITFQILTTDLQQLLDNENPPARSDFAGFDYGRYHTYDEVSGVALLDTPLFLFTSFCLRQLTKLLEISTQTKTNHQEG